MLNDCGRRTTTDPDDLVRRKLADTEIYLTATDIPVDTGRAFRLPFDEPASLGAGSPHPSYRVRVIVATV